MRVAILGTGNVAKALAEGFRRNHEVTIGTRDPGGKSDGFGELDLKSLADAASGAEVIVLAVKGLVVAEAISQAGPENFAGKVVIDVTNPLDQSSPPQLAAPDGKSNGEFIQKLL